MASVQAKQYGGEGHYFTWDVTSIGNGEMRLAYAGDGVSVKRDDGNPDYSLICNMTCTVSNNEFTYKYQAGTNAYGPILKN